MIERGRRRDRNLRKVRDEREENKSAEGLSESETIRKDISRIRKLDPRYPDDRAGNDKASNEDHQG